MTARLLSLLVAPDSHHRIRIAWSALDAESHAVTVEVRRPGRESFELLGQFHHNASREQLWAAGAPNYPDGADQADTRSGLGLPATAAELPQVGALAALLGGAPGPADIGDSAYRAGFVWVGSFAVPDGAEVRATVGGNALSVTYNPTGPDVVRRGHGSPATGAFDSAFVDDAIGAFERIRAALADKRVTAAERERIRAELAAIQSTITE